MGANEESVFDAYRDRVERPLARLFRVYGRPEIAWFTLGMAANVVARVASLLPPLVLGIAIDAIFVDTEPFSLPVVPDAWLPATQSDQFWFSAALIGGAFLTTALFTWVYGVAANLFAHRVMHAVRTDSFERMERSTCPSTTTSRPVRRRSRPTLRGHRGLIWWERFVAGTNASGLPPPA